MQKSIARPQVHNAFRPQTVKEMINALADARYDEKVGNHLTGLGEKAFCSGGDQVSRVDYGIIEMIQFFTQVLLDFNVKFVLVQTSYRSGIGLGWSVGVMFFT